MGLFSKKEKVLSSPQRRRNDQGKVRIETPLNDLDQRYNFRRNRTLTGSISSHVASASESNAQFKSPRVQSHELIKKRRRVGSLFTLVVFGALAVYGLTQQFTAEAVVKSGVPGDVGSTYKEAIQAYFGTRPIERFRFLTNHDALNEYVKQKLPEVASVRVAGSAGLGKSLYSLVMREPLVGWTIEGKRQYVDASGTPFEKNFYPAPSVQVVDNSGARSEGGQVIASNRFLAFVGRTVGLAKAQGYVVTQVTVPVATTRQVELRLEGVGYPVKMSIDRSVGEQIEDMVRLIRWFQSRKETPQYIDIRVSGKAFYR